MTKPQEAHAKPRFVGASSGPTVTPALIYRYMTAEQMQAKVTALTGYEHPDFITYANILGHSDPKSGTRTTAEPTLLSVLLMQRIALDVAAMVMEREEFLSDRERIVMPGIDLSRMPTAVELESFCSALYRRWLTVPLSPPSLNALVAQFVEGAKTDGPAAGYQAVLALMLEHGGLYYI